jgi:hypothetical protein
MAKVIDVELTLLGGPRSGHGTWNLVNSRHVTANTPVAIQPPE